LSFGPTMLIALLAAPRKPLEEVEALALLPPERSHHKECVLWVKGGRHANQLSCGNSANRFLIRVVNCSLSALRSCATRELCLDALFSCVRGVSPDFAGGASSAAKL